VNATPQLAPDIDTVGLFMMPCSVKAPGEEIAARAIYARLPRYVLGMARVGFVPLVRQQGRHGIRAPHLRHM
jgi:hypothetical protein